MNLGEYIETLDAPSSSGIPKATPEDFGAETARGLKTLARKAMDLDQAFRQQADELQRVQDVSALTLSAHKRVTDLNVALEAKPDWQTHEANWAKGFRKIREETLQGINDPVVKKAMTSKLGEIEAAGLVHAKQRSRQLAIDTAKANLTNTVTGAMENAAAAQDPSALVGLGIGAIRGAVATGVISAEEGAKYENDFVEGVQVGFAKRDILQDPAVYWQKKQAGVYGSIRIGKFDLLDEAAIRQAEHNERMAEHQLKKEQDKNSAVILAGVENGTVNDAQLDDAFLGPTRDPNFTPKITPEAYKAGKVKLAAQRREGGARNPSLVNSFKIEIALSPGRYSDKEILGLSDKGLNPSDVLDLIEYKKARVKEMQELPPGASTQMEIIRQAIPRGFLNTMTDKHRAALVDAEQEFITRVKKDPGRVLQIGAEIANRLKALKGGGGSPAELEALRKEVGEAGR